MDLIEFNVDEDLEFIDIDRSFAALIDTWENDPDIPISDLCEYLDNLVQVVDGNLTYNEFTNKCNMNENNQSWLN